MTSSPDIEEVVAEHGPMIMRIAAIYEADSQRAADLTQDILVALWKALPRYRGNASLRTFAARIAHNRCVSHVVRDSKAPRLTALHDDLPSPADGPEQAAISRDRRAQLLTAIRKLPVAYRAPVTLALEGFSPPEVAELLGISTNAVSVRLSRAKTLLRQHLQGGE